MGKYTSMTEENIEETHVEDITSQEIEELALENEQDVDEGGESTDGETPDEKIARLERTNKQLYNRLKKPTVKKTTKTKPNSSITREEAILFAKGHTEEEVDLASKLSKINGTTLSESSKDPYFKSLVDTRVKKEKSAKAALGASGGSNKFTTLKVGEMTREEHVELFHKTMGNA
jgi:hypothetical protein